MTTRTRYKGSNLFAAKPLRLKMVESTGAVVWDGVIANHSERINPAHETMTDVYDNPSGLNQVTHTKRYVECTGSGGIVAKGPKYVYNKKTYQDTYYGTIPLLSLCSSWDSHISVNGLRELAIARVPAYDQAQLQGFVSLSEALGLSNSLVAKAASALGNLGFGLYSAIRRGRIKGKLGRETARILDELLRNRKRSPAEMWRLFLSSLNHVSNVDMEWKYGLAPMVRDCQTVSQIVDKLSTLHADLVKGKRVYGRATDTRTAYQTGTTNIGASGYGSVGLLLRQATKVSKATGTASIVRALSPNVSMYDVQWFNTLDVVLEMNGLKPSKRGLWQLLPLSFVVDWFWNVSSLLESMDELKVPGSDAIISHSGLYSEKTETRITTGLWFEHAQPHTTYAGVSTFKTYQRNADALIGRPTLYIPPFNLPVDTGRWFAMAQLAFQRFVGKHR